MTTQAQLTSEQPISAQLTEKNSSELKALEYFHITCSDKSDQAIAAGVILPSGAFAISWFGENHSHGTYPSLAVFRKIQAQMPGRKIVTTKAPSGKTFYLQRNQDWNGISGTGKVAIGFEFDRITVLQWLGKNGSTFWYESIKRVEQVHGHEGRTLVVRIDG